MRKSEISRAAPCIGQMGRKREASSSIITEKATVVRYITVASDSRSLALAQAQGGQHLTIVDYSHPIENGTYDSFPQPVSNKDDGMY